MGDIQHHKYFYFSYFIVLIRLPLYFDCLWHSEFYLVRDLDISSKPGTNGQSYEIIAKDIFSF